MATVGGPGVGSGTNVGVAVGIAVVVGVVVGGGLSVGSELETVGVAVDSMATAVWPDVSSSTGELGTVELLVG